MPSSPAEINAFWIAHGDDSPLALRRRDAVWYRSTPALDEEIESRFGATLEAAANGKLKAWQDTAAGALALVILLDQFSRNIHRRKPAAWQYDDQALSVARTAVAAGLDTQLGVASRVMLYHPFHHAEDRAMQAEAVRLFEQLAAANPDWDEALRMHVEVTRSHAGIIEQFGRFPHRNATLSRTSTPDELAYLAANNKRYGQ